MAKKKLKQEVQEGVLLSELTTIKLGGKAKYFMDCSSEEEIISALKYADENELKVFVMSGGSNVVFPDDGFDGLVIRVNNKGIEFNGETVTVKAGEDWDEFVQKCIENDLQGIECLSGIPGSVGSTPIQNVGAYGQEVREVIVSVNAINRDTLEEMRFTNEDCDFKYRSSRFKEADKDKYIITEVTFLLNREKVPQVRYAELNKYLNEFEKNFIKLKPGKEMLTALRKAVINIRKTKSMVIDPKDPNSVSCGSFFLNPVLDHEEYIRFKRACRRKNINFPRFKTPEGRKIPAAWIIENAGFQRGYRKGNVGISENHSLALVNYGGTTEELLELAEEILERVEDQLRVELFYEPVIVNS